MKFGVVRFPGSCDERRRAARGAAASARPSCSGTATRDLQRRRRGDRPRRLLLRRLPARRRDRALRAGDGRGRALRRATAGSCSASATASRCCARRGCCRARCCRTRRCGSSAARSSSRSSTPRPPWTGACEAGERAVDPGQAHDRPLLGARSGARRARGQRPGRAALRRRARTSTARRATSPACRNAAGNVVGLMPHPEHAVDALTGSADGLKLFESAAAACRADEQASRARPHRLRVRPDRREAGARAERGRARRVLA